MRYLTACAIAKDEDPFLEEWIRYHQLLGVEHFYLYDNDSRTPLAESLRPFIAEGLVDVERVEGHGWQHEVYTRCSAAHARDTRWMAMLDLDEFLVPHRHDSLPELLSRHEAHDGLAINWQIFGTSGHQERPPGLQIENFTRKLPESSQPNEHVKTIACPARVLLWKHSHIPTYREGHWSVNEDGERVDGPFAPVRVATVQVNHYYTRSRADWRLKLIRGRASVVPGPGVEKRSPTAIDWIDENAVVEDTAIWRFLPALKARIAGDIA